MLTHWPDVWPDFWHDGPHGFFARVALTLVVTVLIMTGHP